MIVVSILVFILVFAVIVFVHELGHFLVAKWSGIKVEEFAFGFPPKLISWHRSGTKYAINLIPIGGYVKLKGEESASPEKDSLTQKNGWQQSATMIAGVVMNLILAWLILTFLIAIPNSWKSAEGVFVAGAIPGSAAESIGLKVGDVVSSIDGQKLSTSKELRDYTTSHTGQSVTLTVKHNGISEQKKVILGVGDAPLGASTNTFSLVSAEGEKWWQAPWLAIKEIGVVIALNAIFIYNLVLGLFGQGTGGVADQVSGPIGIYGVVAQLIAFGWIYVLYALAQLSLAVAIFNILPLPALDGGRIFFIWLNKLLGKRKIKFEVEGIIHAIGFSALILLFLFVTYRDIMKLIN